MRSRLTSAPLDGVLLGYLAWLARLFAEARGRRLALPLARRLAVVARLRGDRGGRSGGRAEPRAGRSRASRVGLRGVARAAGRDVRVAAGGGGRAALLGARPRWTRHARRARRPHGLASSTWARATRR